MLVVDPSLATPPFEQIKQHCPHVTEKMIRDRLFRGERKMARLSRPPDSRKGVDKPKSWR